MVVENYDKAHRSIIHFRSAYDLTKSMDHVRRTTLLQRIFQIFTGPDNQVKIFFFFFFFFFFLMDSCSIGIVLKNLTGRHFFIIEGFEKLKMASNMSANTGFSTIHMEIS